MNRIQLKFEELKNKKQKALVTFITAGDPSLETAEKLIETLVNSGQTSSNWVSLQIRWPTALSSSEPPNGRSSTTQTCAIFSNSFKKSGRNLTVPMVLMGYYNPILSYGTDQFCVDAKNAGVDRLIVVDLPLEESAELDIPAGEVSILSIFSPQRPMPNGFSKSKKSPRDLSIMFNNGRDRHTNQRFDAVAQHVKQIRKESAYLFVSVFGIKTEEPPKNSHNLGIALVHLAQLS